MLFLYAGQWDGGNRFGWLAESYKLKSQH